MVFRKKNLNRKSKKISLFLWSVKGQKNIITKHIDNNIIE